MLDANFYTFLKFKLKLAFKNFSMLRVIIFQKASSYYPTPDEYACENAELNSLRDDN